MISGLYLDTDRVRRFSLGSARDAVTVTLGKGIEFDPQRKVRVRAAAVAVVLAILKDDITAIKPFALEYV